MFLHESMQSVVILACDKHASAILEKVNQGEEGNWFVLPSASLFKTGYWPNVSNAHQGGGCAIFGFIESMALAQRLKDFDSANLDNGVCPDCAIYEWNVASLHMARTTRDPVCRRVVSCNNSVSQTYQDHLFFFCSTSCRDRFHEAPSKFVTSPPQQEFPTPKTS